MFFYGTLNEIRVKRRSEVDDGFNSVGGLPFLRMYEIIYEQNVYENMGINFA